VVLAVQQTSRMLWLAIGDSGWFAQTALVLIMTVFLTGGILLTAMAIRDLVRDFWHFLHPHSH
jgi:hypothetical protein